MNEEGDLENPETIVINADEMFLQDLGSAAYTEFEHDDVAEHIMDNEHLMDYRVGLIHSHHTMGAFFSGTDQEELHEKAANGLYLSLIVNNHMEPVAKLAWTGEVERKIESYTSWQWGMYIRDRKKQTRTEMAKIVYEVDLDIEFDPIFDVAKERYNELKEEEDIRAAAKKVHYSGRQANMFGAWGDQFKGTSMEARDKTIKASEQLKLSTRANETLAERLHHEGQLNKAFAVILTQSPKTEHMGIHGALTELLDELRDGARTMQEDNETYSEAYERECFDKANDIITDADDIIAEWINEFYIDEEEIGTVLARLYDALEKVNGIFIDALKMGLEAVLIEGEIDPGQVEDAKAKEEEDAAAKIPPVI